MTDTTSTAQTASVASPPSAASRILRRIVGWEGLGLLIAFIVLYVALSLLTPDFLTAANQLSILQNAAFFGIVAFAMTLVIVSGEIDISVGSMAALSSSLIGVFVVKQGIPMFIAIFLVLGIAALIGSFAGAMRAYFNVPTFISTLALYLALRGLAQLLTSNFPIPIPASEFFYWGTGRILGIPVAALYFVGIAIVVGVVARRTVFGRSIYAVGGNAKAAGLSGIPVRRIKIMVMAISATVAALTGLLQSALLSSGNSTIAVGLEFDAIAATIIGGAALTGGKGTIVGTSIGVLFIAALINGMVLLGVNPYAQQVIRGVVVLVAVVINVWRSRRSAV